MRAISPGNTVQCPCTALQEAEGDNGWIKSSRQTTKLLKRGILETKKEVDSGASGFDFQFCHQLAVSPYASHFLHLLIYNMSLINPVLQMGR